MENSINVRRSRAEVNDRNKMESQHIQLAVEIEKHEKEPKNQFGRRAT